MSKGPWIRKSRKMLKPLYSKKTRSEYSSKSKEARKVAIGSKRTSIEAIPPILAPKFSLSPEVKKSSQSYVWQLFNSSVSNNTADIINVLGPLPQGSGQANRVGNRVRFVKLVIDGHYGFDADGSNAVSYGQILVSRLMVYQDKSNRCNANSLQANEDKLLDGGGTALTYSGTALDNHYPFNLDGKFSYMDKVTYHEKSTGSTNSATSAYLSAGKNTSVPFTCVIEPGNGAPTYLHFDESVSNNWAVNFAPKISLAYSYAQNNVPDSVTTQIGMTFVATTYYVDV